MFRFVTTSYPNHKYMTVFVIKYCKNENMDELSLSVWRDDHFLRIKLI